MGSMLRLFAGCVLLLCLPLQSLAQGDGTTSDARVIVKYKADSKLLRKDLATPAAQRAAQTAALGQRVGLSLRAGESVDERAHVLFASGMTSEQLAQRLSAESDIEYAIPDERRRHTSAP